MAPFAINEYHVGIICALHTEMAAVRAMLDEEHGTVTKKDFQDHNTYFAGRVHEHNVIIACLPAGVDGLAAAATVAKDMSRTFQQLRIGLLVGIGGGIPDLEAGVDIRLGDVVVSLPTGTSGGLVQYDKGKNKVDGFELKGTLNAPPVVLLTALQSLRAEHEMNDSQMPDYLSDMLKRRPKMRSTGYVSPGAENDHLYLATCDHMPDRTICDACEGQILSRLDRETSEPQIHYGVIASGNQVIKSTIMRDELRRKFGALCVEMEAAGLMNEFPCLVIRGICDYADSHKNDKWHRYAAATAAAYAKELLQYVSVEQTSQEKPVQQVIDLLSQHVSDSHEHYQNQAKHNIRHETFLEQQELRYLNDKQLKCLQVFKTSDYLGDKNINPDKAEGTCQWVLKHERYVQWQQRNHDDLLWISADPGCGKSVLSKSLVDSDLRHDETESTPITICYFFFKDNEKQDTLANALCALLHQLFTQQPKLILHAMKVYEQNGESIRSESETLWQILKDATNDPEAGITICVLDALDECKERDGKRLVSLLCDFHKQVPSKSNQTTVKFLVTSRPYDDIEETFQQMPSSIPSIRLRGEDENDQIHEEINHVISLRVAKLATELKLSQEIKDRIEAKLLGMEHRTYLWLYLAIENIRKRFHLSLRPDQVSIDSLPATVEDAYEKILARVEHEQRDIVRKILLIIVAAKRALTIGEMALALDIATSSSPLLSLSDFRINPDRLETNIRQWCGLFVFINHSRIYLIHLTAKEYLITRDDLGVINNGLWKHSLSPLEAEKTMARVCVLFLCLQEFNQKLVGEERSSSMADSEFQAVADQLRQSDEHVHELFLFSAEHWVHYVRNTEIDLDQITKEKMSLLYDTSSERFLRWYPVMWKPITDRGYRPRVFNQTLLAAYNGHAEMLATILNADSQDLESTDFQAQTSLLHAVERGHGEAVRVLIQHGADLNFRKGPYGSALQCAAYHGFDDIVHQLLQVKACIDAPTQIFSSALLAACSDELPAPALPPPDSLPPVRKGNPLKVVCYLLQNGCGRLYSGLGYLGSDVATTAEQNLGRENQITEEVLTVAAASTNHQAVEIMQHLLEKGGDQIKITETILRAVVGNTKYADRLMVLLLETRNDDIVITEKVLLSASANKTDAGTNVWKILLDQGGRLVQVTEKMIDNALSSALESPNMLRFLIEQQEIKFTAELVAGQLIDMYNPNETIQVWLILGISPSVLVEAALTALTEHPLAGGRAIIALLDAGVETIPETEEVVAAVLLAVAGDAGSSKWVPILLDLLGPGFVVSETVMLEAAKGSPETLKTLLEYANGEILLTDSIVIATVENYHSGASAFQALLNYGKSALPVTEAVMLAVVQKHGGGEILQLLSDQRPHDIILTDAVIETAANGYDGHKVMQLLLEQRSQEISITEALMCAAAKGEQGPQVVQLLLDERGQEVVITEMVLAAAARGQYGSEVMRLFLEQREQEVVVTEAVMIAAAGNYYGLETMQFLLTHQGHKTMITEAVLLEAVGNVERLPKLQLLLSQPGERLVITEAIVLEGLKYYNDRKVETLQVLLGYSGKELFITEKIVVAALHDYTAMNYLLDQRGKEIHITSAVMKEAARLEEEAEDMMELLVVRKGEEMEINEDVLMKIVAGASAKTMKLLLDQRGKDVNITQAAIQALAMTQDDSSPTFRKHPEMMLRCLLQHPLLTGHFTTNAIEAIMFWFGVQELELAFEHITLGGISSTILHRIVDGENATKKLELLLEREADLVITEKTLHIAARSDNVTVTSAFPLDRFSSLSISAEVLKRAVWSSNAAEILPMLLRKNPGLVITQEIFEMAAFGDTAVETMTFLLERDPTLTINESVLAIAATNGYAREVLPFVFEKNPNLETSVKVLRMAANGRDPQDALRFSPSEESMSKLRSRIVRCRSTESIYLRGLSKRPSRRTRRPCSSQRAYCKCRL